MELIIQQLSTIVTLYITDVIKFENRMLTNSIITIITFSVIGSINYLFKNWKKLYNSIIYFLYDMKNHPLEIWRAPYLYDFIISSEDIFITEYYHSAPYEYIRDNQIYCKIQQKKTINGTSEYISLLIEKSRMSLMKNYSGKSILITPIEFHQYPLNQNNLTSIRELGIYLISIDKFGNPIYYGTNQNVYYKDRNSYLEFEKHLSQFITREFYKSQEKKMNKNGIYILKNKVQKEIGKISEKKTFDTLFYTQKEELMKILHKFKEKNLYPPHVPMDNKLGILLYGPPGTGKTGTISAIANYLGRNLTLINFSEISSIEEFEMVFNSNKYEETIFIFDEFDCILNTLENINSQSEKTDWGRILLASEGNERKQIIDMIKTGKNSMEQPLNMAYLLQKLDGLESAEGRIIIATTNNPDKINPILLRPGRFDIKLCLGNCTTDMYCKILENYYKNENNVINRVINTKIPEFKYSPLEIMNLAMQNNSLDSLLEILKS